MPALALEAPPAPSPTGAFIPRALPPSWPDRDTVHVWLAALDGVPSSALAMLDHAERARAGAIISVERRELWARARAVLRMLLGHYLHVHPQDVHLEPGARGKPSLCAQTARAAGSRGERLCFNLSHSRALALYAFADSLPVGVDIEAARPLPPRTRLAQRALGASARTCRARFVQPLGDGALLQAWTEHEATLKCSGAGLATDCSSSEQGSAPEPLAPWTTKLEAGPRAFAALAAASEPRSVHRWKWTPCDLRGHTRPRDRAVAI
jgi:4'-phosphopantetheinyl transferase